MHFHVIMHQIKEFWRVMGKPAFPGNNASYLHFVFGCVMRKPAFLRINAPNLNVLVVMRKPAFPCNNASGISIFDVHEKTCFET